MSKTNFLRSIFGSAKKKTEPSNILQVHGLRSNDIDWETGLLKEECKKELTVFSEIEISGAFLSTNVEAQKRDDISFNNAVRITTSSSGFENKTIRSKIGIVFTRAESYEPATTHKPFKNPKLHFIKTVYNLPSKILARTVTFVDARITINRDFLSRFVEIAVNEGTGAEFLTYPSQLCFINCDVTIEDHTNLVRADVDKNGLVNNLFKHFVFEDCVMTFGWCLKLPVVSISNCKVMQYPTGSSFYSLIVECELSEPHELYKPFLQPDRNNRVYSNRSGVNISDFEMYKSVGDRSSIVTFLSILPICETDGIFSCGCKKDLTAFEAITYLSERLERTRRSSDYQSYLNTVAAYNNFYDYLLTRAISDNDLNRNGFKKVKPMSWLRFSLTRF